MFFPFHDIKMYNYKPFDLRRELFHEAGNLNDKRNEKHHLEEALKPNESYYMKEYLRQIWKQHNETIARECLDDWVVKAKSSGIKMLIHFANTLLLYRRGNAAYYNYPISTGSLEGTNKKIKIP